MDHYGLFSCFWNQWTQKTKSNARKNFLWMVVGFIILLLGSGNAAIPVLFALVFFAFIVFLIGGIVALFKRNGKAKKRFLLMLGAMVLWLGSAAMLPDDQKDTKNQASEAKVKSKTDDKKKAASSAKKEAEAKAKAEAEAKAAAEEKAKAEAEAKAQAEAEAKAKAEAEAKAQAEAEAKAKAEAEAKAQAEAEAKAKQEAEAKAKAEAEAQARAQQQQQTTSAQTVGKTSFANCTDLRTVYPNGVASDHPAYTSKMDRDNDGYACERN